MPPCIYWTPEEEEVLIAEYSWRNLTELADDLNKTMYGIRNKAKQLKLTRYPLNLKRSIKKQKEIQK